MFKIYKQHENVVFKMRVDIYENSFHLINLQEKEIEMN